jgi:hypothetical protein
VLRLLKLLVLLIVGIVLVALAVANRTPVTLSLDPFTGAAPLYAVRMPLFVVVFVALIIGTVLGAIVAPRRGRRPERRAAPPPKLSETVFAHAPTPAPAGAALPPPREAGRH